MTTYYKFDLYGFYDGETEQALQRTTDVEPTNKSITTTPGENRANWTGYEWRDQAYYAPTVQTVQRFTKKQFRSRVGFMNLVALKQAAETDYVLKVLEDDFFSAEYIDITDAETTGGVSLLVSKGIITQAQADDILEVEVIPASNPYPDEV